MPRLSSARAGGRAERASALKEASGIATSFNVLNPALKSTLSAEDLHFLRISEAPATAPEPDPKRDTDATSILERLGAGELTFDEAMVLLRDPRRRRET